MLLNSSQLPLVPHQKLLGTKQHKDTTYCSEIQNDTALFTSIILLTSGPFGLKNNKITIKTGVCVCVGISLQ